MAVDKLVDSTQLNADLTSVANAIRTKGGTSAQLAFPSDFVSAVNAIPAGGGVTPTGTKQISVLQNGVISEDVTNYASAEITANVPQMKEIAIRPDAELWKSWTYDKRIVADEGVTIPPYQTTNITLKGTEQLDEITADAANYKYFLTLRTLVIPEYSITTTGRGRFEWSLAVGAYDFVFTPMEELHPLVDSTYTVATTSASVQGGVSYRSLYFSSSTGISIYPNTVYGIWTSAVTPSYLVGKIRVNSPNFTMRAQANILDQLYYEALTDIRFQYVYELWRVPIGSLQYDGWSNQQLADHTLDCLYSANHKLI